MSAKQSDLLLGLAHQCYEFGQDTDGAPYAMDVDAKQKVAMPLRGGRLGFRASLAASYVDSQGTAPSASALTDAMLVVEGWCRRADPVPTHLRVADVQGFPVIDLGHIDGGTVKIDPYDGTWCVSMHPSVTWRRTELTGALPTPIRDLQTSSYQGLDRLRDLLTVTDESWPLVLGWLVAALTPNIPYPVLLLSCEQGSAKSTTAKMLTNLIDPSPAPLRTAPRDVEGWVLAASGSWVVTLDNISEIKPWLSDALCRASTGDAMVRRALYTDSSLVVTALQRPVMLTSIDTGAIRGDLADRLVTVELGRIAPEDRRLDAEVTAQYQADHPVILGALLSLVARVHRDLGRIELDGYPRMADYARILAAVDQCLDTNALRTYMDLGARQARELIDDDPVAAAIVDLVRDRTDPWSGTAAELLDKITPHDPPKSWPATARALAGALRRGAPALREVGIIATYNRINSARTWTLEKVKKGKTDTDVDEGRSRPSLPSPPSPTPSDLGRSGDGTRDDLDISDGTTVTPVTDRHHETPGHDASDGSDDEKRASSTPTEDQAVQRILDAFPGSELVTEESA